MKKKLCILFIIIAGTVVYSSCKKDPLNKLPDGILTRAQAFDNPDLARGFLSDTYATIPQYMDSYFFFSMLASKSDEAADSDLEFSSGNWNAGTLSLTNNPLQPMHGDTYWNRFWAGIRKANIFIESIGLTPINEGNSSSNAPTREVRDQWIAEARLLRAFFHLEIMKYHGGIPITDKSYDPGLDFTQITRNTFDECAQWIVKECNEAMVNLPLRRLQTGQITEIGIGRMTKGVAMAIKSRVLLYNASPLHNPSNDASKWKQAADASKELLDLAASTGAFQLYKSATPANGARNSYEMFTRRDNGDASLTESILQHPNPWSGPGHLSFVHGIPSASNFKSGTNPSQELVDAFETISGEPAILGYSDASHLVPIVNPAAADYSPANPYANRDPRLTAFIYYNNAYWGKKGSSDYYVQAYEGGLDQLSSSRNNTRTGYYLKKFTDVTRGNGTLSNGNPSGQSFWSIFRLAEIYLNYAEAANEANGPTAAVLDALNIVRARAGMPPVLAKYASTKEVLRERIRNERRVELCFEEHRFFDVRRWKILDNTDRLITGMRIAKNGNDFTYSRILVESRNAWSDKFLIFPIPVEEINRMPNFGQNPGW